ncbi:MAG TPA: neuraminidase-like domain-containing protein, partial [Gemmatimonadaceae bacterium]|nr:neuraminidase-like domain-containing protein [Gemmatimonadaceae bacterium]
AEARALRLVGILSADEKSALDALSSDAAYRAAVDSLFTQPAGGTFDASVLWLEDADLHFPLRDPNDPAADNLNANLATAVAKGLAYLSRSQSEGLVVRQAAAELGLTEALARHLLADYAILPDTLLAILTGPFAASTGAVDYATLQPVFDGWFWATRVAAPWKQWKLTLAEWERLRDLTAGAQLLDPTDLPLTAGSSPPPTEAFVRTARLLALRDALPEPGLTLLELLANLDAGAYASPAAFAADVERVNDAWSAADVEALLAAIDLVYPGDYLLAESWERVRRVFAFGRALNAGVATLAPLAGATMGAAEAATVKGLLRSSLDPESWRGLSAQIQDILRERKRDALTAYLLSQPMPADAPTGKWETPDDLYAYYLLDVEMGACQLTSRLVQGSGSVQLLVQRCFMGLEPEVVVSADGANGAGGGDSAWSWWRWMSKYRVWEANRKVFLWPENWIEPELRPDRSPIFEELTQELLQGDVTADTAETAFANYVEKLDGVAQLEIAGFYQQDDHGDDTTLHVFGRTPGTDPRVHYYRRFDYRRWTAWEKVDLDIQGDYLIPAVVDDRLFLFWPVFTEVPDEEANSSVPTPVANQSSFPIKKTVKRHKVQLAVSDYRHGAWTPKKISKDAYQSGWITAVDIVRKFYDFVPLDRTDIDGRFLVKFDGYALGSDGYEQAELHGTFEIGGCSGVPALVPFSGKYVPAVVPEWASVGQYQNPDKRYTSFMKWSELGRADEFGKLIGRHDAPQNDFTLENTFASDAAARFTPVLLQTPWYFRMTPPWQLSLFDRLLLDGLTGLGSAGAASSDVKRSAAELPVPLGSWLPYFYDDRKRTFFVLPVLRQSLGSGGDTPETFVLRYYPEVERIIRQLEEQYAAQVRAWVAGLDLLAYTPVQRQQLDQRLWNAFPDEAPPPLHGGSPPPYTAAEAAQVRTFVERYLMRFFHANLGALALRLLPNARYHFRNFYHPFVCDFAKLLQNPRLGVPALMRREVQLQDSGFSFRQQYQPTPAVLDPSAEQFYPREVVDFTIDGAYSPYNWELFFHVPLLIADALSRNQRFDEARDWYHYIFNPIGVESAAPGGSAMSKYWITKPFYETTDPQYVQQRIDDILRMLAGDTTVPGFSSELRQALEEQVRDWRDHPFEPHRIASYRTVAYQKTVVMKYLDNLIAWGDNLFRQDSMESINEATQLYVMAAELLGPRPMKVPPRARPPLRTFNELAASLDDFADALVQVENLVPPQSGNGGGGGAGSSNQPPLPTLYFCIPQNDKLLGYWDTVADRLYKVRHCMNIEGVVRQLALFEPPLDPGALVKGVALGADLGSALADLNAPLPLYRFNVLLQKANEACGDVKSLGGELLAALQTRDAEALGRLRQGQEVRLLQAMRAVKERQLDEARANLEGAQRARELATRKQEYYVSREFMSVGEIAALALATDAAALSTAVQLGYALAGTARTAVPQFTTGGAGFGGSPVATVTYGGETIGDAGEDAGQALLAIAGALEKASSLAGTLAGYQRRQDDWTFQADLAGVEIAQAEQAIAAAEARVAIAEKELENHDLQIANSQEVDAFMRSKFTNLELFQWQVGQVSQVFFRSYQLAYDLARRAERCFRFELGLEDSDYITFGYWDSLKRGLLSGEKLQQDLRRLESAYLEQNRREFELTKHVSLLQLDPLALVRLRETGRCFFDLPEEIFDLDYPGHYFRRIKSVSLTLPSVTGPYTTVSCTLRLLRNSIRVATDPGSQYARNTDDAGLPADDERFVEHGLPVAAIAASGAQNDSGMFELNFRDERYLPFEGAGVISGWSLELFTDPTQPDFGEPLRQFDYDTISDAVLHVKYTAREDAGPLKTGAIAHLREYYAQTEPAPALLMLNLRRDFPSQWSRFLNPTNPADGNVFELEMSPALFPTRDAGKSLTITRIWLLGRGADPGNYTVRLTPPLPAPPPAASNVVTLSANAAFGGLHVGSRDVSTDGVEVAPVGPATTWHLQVTPPGGGNLTVDAATGAPELRDLLVVLSYAWG